MLRKWLSEPHIGGWWDDPETEIALIEEDLENGPTDMRVVWADKPFAYVQDYPANHWPMPQYEGCPKGTRAIDTFLGDPDYLGQGHAARYLHQRAKELIASGATAIVVDPDPKNHKAINAYRSAGFTGDKTYPCEDGDPVLVLTFTAS